MSEEYDEETEIEMLRRGTMLLDRAFPAEADATKRFDRIIVDYKKLREDVGRMRTALSKINDIRNSIIGFHTVNWSEHIYPLVAALGEAGYKGDSYDKSREDVGKLLDRCAAVEAENKKLKAMLAGWLAATGPFHVTTAEDDAKLLADTEAVVMGMSDQEQKEQV